MISFMFSIIFSSNSFASSWTVNVDQSIYERAYDEEQQEAIQKELEGLDSRYDGIAGDVLGDLFSKLFITVGDQSYKLLAGIGFDLNAIIFGRVGGSAYLTDNISLFTYELKSGNIYGIASMAIFNVLRGSFAILMICVLWYSLVAFIYSSGSAKSRERLKENVTGFIILFLSLLLMPNLLDVVLYVKDIILYSVMVRGSDLINSVGSSINSSWDAAAGTGSVAFDFFGTGGQYNLVGTFRTLVKNDPSFTNSCMYLGSVILQFYFGVTYICSTVAMVVLVVMYAFVCWLELIERGVMHDWIKQVAGILLNPIIDSCLLLIPMLVAVLGYDNDNVGYSFVALIICSCVIPARGVIRSLLHLGNGMGFELAGLGAAFGAMRLGSSLIKGLGGMVSRTREGMTSAKNDEDLAGLYNEQAQMLDLASVNEEEDMKEDMEGMFRDGEGIDASGIPFQPVSEAEMSGMSAEERVRARNANMNQGLEALNIRKGQLSDEAKQWDTRSSEISQEIADIDGHTSELKAERASLNQKDPNQLGAIQEIDQKIAENGIDKQKLVSEQARIRSENSWRKEQIGRIDTLSTRAKSAIVGMRAGGLYRAGSGNHNGGMSAVSDEQALLDRYANIDNFEMPAFSNISLERKSELYQKRAKQTRMKALGSATMGTVGGVAGAAVGFGGTTFFSPTAKMYGMSAFMDIGASTGDVVGGVVGSKVVDFPRPKVPQVKLRGPGGPSPSSSGPAISGYIEQPQVTIQTASDNYYSDNDQERHYPRATPNYKQNWVFPEEELQKHENTFQAIMSDDSSKKVMNQRIKRAMREVSVIARQSKESIKMGGEIPKTESERAEKNQMIIEEAVDSFSRSLSESISMADIPEYVARSNEFNFDDFGRYIEDRYTKTSATQLKNYLKSKGILF